MKHIQAQRPTNKTNRQWYAYPDLGSWFRLKDGVLLFSPMLVDGGCDGDAECAEVDFANIDDAIRMRAVSQDLAEKA